MGSARRVLVIGAAALVVLAIGGALYQTLSVRSEARRFPALGTLVTVEGERRLHLVCIGAGEPTVIFEAGGFGGGLSASAAREEVSRHTRVCSYSRMGMGSSDPGPSVISVGMLADDLERLTVRAGLRAPFILVPTSFGGLTVELFARRHPGQVAGMVFVDAANSAIVERFAPDILRKPVGAAACVLPIAARLGILRAGDPMGLRKLPPDTAGPAIAFLYRVETAMTFCGVARGVGTTVQEFEAAPALDSKMRLTVLVHETPDGMLPPGMAAETRILEGEWLPLQQRFAQRSRRGTWQVVPGSDHLMSSRKPAEVARGVLEMVAEVRDAR
jgi:pimeloyl-ACP methyl ester carboxylesterase